MLDLVGLGGGSVGDGWIRRHLLSACVVEKI